MKDATSIILPDEVLDFILHAYDTKEKCSSKLGCHSFVHNLTSDLNTFIKTDHIPSLKKKFFNGISECIIQRAFNFKKTYGATQATRNLLSLYATLYPEQFKSYLNYLKEPDNVLYQITALVYNKNNEKWEEYKDLKDKEYKIVIKANGQYDKNKIQVLYKYWP